MKLCMERITPFFLKSQVQLRWIRSKLVSVIHWGNYKSLSLYNIFDPYRLRYLLYKRKWKTKLSSGLLTVKRKHTKRNLDSFIPEHDQCALCKPPPRHEKAAELVYIREGRLPVWQIEHFDLSVVSWFSESKEQKIRKLNLALNSRRDLV